MFQHTIFCYMGKNAVVTLLPEIEDRKKNCIHTCSSFSMCRHMCVHAHTLTRTHTHTRFHLATDQFFKSRGKGNKQRPVLYSRARKDSVKRHFYTVSWNSIHGSTVKCLSNQQRRRLKALSKESISLYTKKTAKKQKQESKPNTEITWFFFLYQILVYSCLFIPKLCVLKYDHLHL